MLWLACSLPTTLRAAVTNYVTTTADSGPGSVRQSILDVNAAGGGTILFSNVSAVTLKQELPEIRFNTALIGADSNRTTLSGNNQMRVLAIGPDSTTILRDLRITAGRATNSLGGGGILNRGNLTLTNCIVGFNRADSFVPALCCRHGGGILSSGALTVISCSISNNFVLGIPGDLGFTGGIGEGGGIYSEGTLWISNSFIGYNGAAGGYGLSEIFWPGGHGGSGFGGGIRVHNASLFVVGSTVAFNRASGSSGGSGNGFSGSGGWGYGGGLYADSSVGELLNCTFTGNSASGGSGTPSGGGLAGQISFDGSLMLKCSTIVFGDARVTAGVFAPGVRIQNTIIAGNGIGSTGDGAAPFISLGHNLIQGLINPPTATDIVNQDPLLGPLQDNGGPTVTHAPLPGSPVIDAGTSCGLALDQRGQLRTSDSVSITNAPGGDGTDIGAVELQDVVRLPPTTNYVTNLQDSGPGSLRQTILDANATGGGKIHFSNLTGSIFLSNNLPTLAANTVIRGPGRDLLTIDANFRPLFTGAAKQISRLTIQRGLPAFRGSFNISDCGLINCRPAVESFGEVTVLNSFIADSVGVNGSFHIYGSATVRACVFTNNYIEAGCSGSGLRPGGAAILLESGRMSVADCMFANNVAEGVSLNFTGRSCDSRGNPAFGGAIHVVQGRLEVSNCSFIGNRALGGPPGPAGATAGGGGIYVANGGFCATNCTFIGNEAVAGDGMPAWTSGQYIPTDGGSGFGGAIYMNGGTGNLVNCTISRNCSKGGSGAKLITIGGLGSPSGGGVGVGAGIAVYGGSCTLINCTIADNRAVGGPYNSLYGSPAGIGRSGGIHQAAGTILLLNSLIAGNFGSTNQTPSNMVVTAWDGSGTVNSQGYNLIGVTNNLAGLRASDQWNVDPLLGPLQDNGGPVLTHALLAGSPAIDSGTNSGIAFDARGQPRTIDNPSVPNAAGGDGTDIGALEVNHILTGIEVRKAGDDILVRFTTVSDKSYGVEYRSEVDQVTWTALPGTVVGTGGIATYIDAGAAVLPRRFYRLFERTP